MGTQDDTVKKATADGALVGNPSKERKSSFFGRNCQALDDCIDDIAVRCRLLTSGGPFQWLIIGAIFIAGANVGISTYPPMEDSVVLAWVDQVVLMLFILECALKIIACGREPWLYWIGPEWGWNNFDFWIVIASLPGVVPGDLDVRFLRLLRLMRVTKLLGKIRELQVIIMGLAAGLGSVVYISMLWLLVLYLYGVVGVTLFADNDPFHFGHLPMAMLTLFRCTTLEDWTDVMYINYYGCDGYDSGLYAPADRVSRIKGWAGSIFNGFDCVKPSTSPMHKWAVVLYFISFTFITTFTVLSLFVGAVVMGMIEAMNDANEEEKKIVSRGESPEAIKALQETMHNTRDKHAKKAGSKIAPTEDEYQGSSKPQKFGDESIQKSNEDNSEEPGKEVISEERSRSRMHWREAKARLAVASKAARAAEEIYALQKATAFKASRMLNIIWAIEKHVVAMEDEDLIVRSFEYAPPSSQFSPRDESTSPDTKLLQQLPRPEALLAHLNMSKSVRLAAEAERESFLQAKARMRSHRRSMSFLFNELHEVTAGSLDEEEVDTSAGIGEGCEKSPSPSKPHVFGSEGHYKSSARSTMEEDSIEDTPNMIYAKTPLLCRKGGCCCRCCFVCCYGPLAQRCEDFEAHPIFECLVTVAIVVAGALVGLQTSYDWPILTTLDDATTLIFIIECIIKVVARGAQPFDYFNDGWNKFDFFVIVGGLLPDAFALFGLVVGGLESIAILRLLRLLRALKLLKSVPQLQIIVLALVRGVSSMGYISLMIVLVFYVFSITAMIFFSSNDPWRFGTLHNAMLTLFQCATLDDWTDVMYTNMLGCDEYAYPMTVGHSSNGKKDGGGGPLGGACSEPFAFGWFAAFFFVCFVVLGSLVLLTLFIGTVNISMEEAKSSLNSKAKEEGILKRISDKHRVSPLHLDSYLELFKIMDISKSGTLLREELAPFLRSINPDFSATDLESVFTLVDRDGSGEVDRPEFVQLMVFFREAVEHGLVRISPTASNPGVSSEAPKGALDKIESLSSRSTSEAVDENSESKASSSDIGRGSSLQLIEDTVGDASDEDEDSFAKTLPPPSRAAPEPPAVVAIAGSSHGEEAYGTAVEMPSKADATAAVEAESEAIAVDVAAGVLSALEASTVVEDAVRDGDYTWAHAAAIWRAVCEKLDQRRATSEHSHNLEAPDFAARPTTAWTRSRAAESNFEIAELRQLEARARVEDKDTQSGSNKNNALDNRRWSRVMSFNESTFDTSSNSGGDSSADANPQLDQIDHIRGAISTLAQEEMTLANEVRLLRQQVGGRRMGSALNQLIQVRLARGLVRWRSQVAGPETAWLHAHRRAQDEANALQEAVSASSRASEAVNSDAKASNDAANARAEANANAGTAQKLAEEAASAAAIAAAAKEAGEAVAAALEARVASAEEMAAQAREAAAAAEARANAAEDAARGEQRARAAAEQEVANALAQLRLAEAAALAAQESALEAEAAQVALQDSALAAEGAVATSEASRAELVHKLEQQQHQDQQARLASERMRLAAAVASATKDGEERAWATASESIAAAQAEAEEASQRAAAAEEAAEAEREAAREIQATFELKAQSVAEQAAAAEARAAAAEAKLADWLAESERQEAAAAAASPVSAPTADRDIHDENNYEQAPQRVQSLPIPASSPSSLGLGLPNEAPKLPKRKRRPPKDAASRNAPPPPKLGTFREKLRVKRLEKVRLAFDKIDVGNDGILNREEVVAAAHSLGMTPEEAGLFFDSVDHDGSGFLDKREIDKEAANHVGMA